MYARTSDEVSVATTLTAPECQRTLFSTRGLSVRMESDHLRLWFPLRLGIRPSLTGWPMTVAHMQLTPMEGGTKASVRFHIPTARRIFMFAPPLAVAVLAASIDPWWSLCLLVFIMVPSVALVEFVYRQQRHELLAIICHRLNATVQEIG